MPLRNCVYRVGLSIIDSLFHRAIWTETWWSDTDADNDAQRNAALGQVSNRLQTPWGPGDWPNYEGSFGFWEMLYPQRRVYVNLPVMPLVGAPSLSETAPEAAFRLQRVGAASNVPRGRINIPILEDRWFTDLPHRRHINVEQLDEQLRQWTAENWPNTITVDDFVIKNVIYHRNTRTWDLVDHYELQRSTTRIWQRWHYYDRADPFSPDRFYAPQELVL